ncbi:MAG: methionyl-tRNA formyltransferase [Bacteroidetes bacterium]|nr:methionyl-tRNA formyltransferase [Bacteroidota bacterium]
MTKQDLRIVFMGTPDFAVESLRILVENGYNVVGVITMPDKPAGRGHKLQPSAVKNYSVEQNLPLLQPEKLKDETFHEALKSWQADLQIVVAFRMLPEVVWNMPRLGTFNLHASLLPQYRGAAPINWAIINGEKETGVTTFFLTHEIDTGKIIKQEKVAIGENDNAGKIHDELMNVGARLVKETVDDLLADKVDAIDQSQFFQAESELKAAPKIFKETCQINWSKSAQQAHNLIRGLSPYPAAWTELKLQETAEPQYFKIFETEVIPEAHALAPATVVSDFKTYLRVATPDGFLELKSIQVPGKKGMAVGEFLRGLKM